MENLRGILRKFKGIKFRMKSAWEEAPQLTDENRSSVTKTKREMSLPILLDGKWVPPSKSKVSLSNSKD